jgi:hypothetical protein
LTIQSVRLGNLKVFFNGARRVSPDGRLRAEPGVPMS